MFGNGTRLDSSQQYRTVFQFLAPQIIFEGNLPGLKTSVEERQESFEIYIFAVKGGKF